MTDVTLRLPPHAVRYLARMCKHERTRLIQGVADWSIQADAAFDSLNAITYAIPVEYDEAAG